VLLPLYTAVMVCAPRVSDAVVKVALPPLRVTVPSVDDPFMKVTVPLGVPVPGTLAARVAVNVTDCPASGLTLLAVSFIDVPPVLYRTM